MKFVALYLFLFASLTFAQISIERVYGDFSFERPVDIQSPDDGTDRVFVVEQVGRVQVFPRVNPTTLETFLDITSIVDTSDFELGLLGITFHPQFSMNGWFYVHYTNAAQQSVISRFTSTPLSSAAVDASTELFLLTVNQPFTNHNSGQLQFGSDGFLYIALGDGGSANDPFLNSQNTQTLLGNILRLDVDNPSNGNNYGIPADNPFADGVNGLPEIFVYGLRNPYRFSFDSDNDNLWIADVGQDTFEEINMVPFASASGSNFGWLPMEGCECFNNTMCDPSQFVLPIHSYPRDVGVSVTGGYVYRGTDEPMLAGKYIFGDFIQGTVFSIEADAVSPACGTSAETLIQNTELFISTFGLIDGGNTILLANWDATGTTGLFRLTGDIIPSPSTIVTPSPVQSIPFLGQSLDRFVSGLIGGRDIRIEWTAGDFQITFRVEVESTGWVGFGISLDGTMHSSGDGSDIVVAYIADNGDERVNDYYTTMRARPVLDTVQNLRDVTVTRDANDIMTIQFTRDLSTGDTMADRILDPSSSIFFISAFNDANPTSDTSFSFHGNNRVAFNVGNLLSSPSPLPVTPSVTSQPSASSTLPVAVSASGTSLPSESVTQVVAVTQPGTPAPTVSTTSIPSGSSTPVSVVGTATNTPTPSQSRTPAFVAGTPPGTPAPTVSTTPNPSGSSTPVSVGIPANTASATRTLNPSGSNTPTVASLSNNSDTETLDTVTVETYDTITTTTTDTETFTFSPISLTDEDDDDDDNSPNSPSSSSANGVLFMNMMAFATILFMNC